MLNKESLEYLVNLGKAEVIEVDGLRYITNKATLITDPIVNYPFQLTTLTGIIDYLNNSIDIDIVGSKMTVHIVSPEEIRIYSALNGDCNRECLVIAKACLPDFAYGKFLDTETFIIELLSKFEDDFDRAGILKLVGNIKEDHVKNTGDNGISQTVTVKAGIATVADIEVPNPVTLAPYRTFPEIEQPESQFVFRLKDGPVAALFNAGGTGWRIDAMETIKSYLDEYIAGEVKEFVKVIM